MAIREKRGNISMPKNRVVSYTAAADSNAADDSRSEEQSEEDDDSTENLDDESSDEVDSAESGGSEDEDDDETEQGESNKTEAVLSTEGCTFDLRNLVAINSHQVSSASLYLAKDSKVAPNEASVTISPENLAVKIDEDHLLEKAREGCTQLLSSLWQLPTERSDAGPMVTLPGHFEIDIPRALVCTRVCNLFMMQ